MAQFSQFPIVSSTPGARSASGSTRARAQRLVRTGLLVTLCAVALGVGLGLGVRGPGGLAAQASRTRQFDGRAQTGLVAYDSGTDQGYISHGA